MIINKSMISCETISKPNTKYKSFAVVVPDLWVIGNIKSIRYRTHSTANNDITILNFIINAVFPIVL